ncbi:MAG: ExeM/NucH family extracellular endonuclease [Pseudomonadota bacterium]
MPKRFASSDSPRTLLAALAAACGLGISLPASAAVVISQVYGGGGNSGAPLTNDFVELHNSGPAAVSLAGWTLQYASSAGSTWGGAQTTALTGAIPAGGYYLVQLGAGTNSAAMLPTPDATGTTFLSTAAGKVALVNSTTVLSGTCPIPGDATVVDFVGYGSANCAESAPAPAPSNTLALIRASVGNSCVDSGNNSADLAPLAPLPRNSGSPAQPCRGGSAPLAPTPAKIYEIQGSGAQSAMTGKVVVTSGVVTRINSNGFFVQDLSGDGNPATSDGIFVFTGATTYPAVVVGNLVGVTATVTEFNTGALPTAAAPTPTLTQLTSVSGVSQIGNGYPIAPTPVTLPESVEGELERYEGMLVTLNGPFTVAQNFFQGRFGQLTLGVNGRLETPTNRHRPGAMAQALNDENARRSIVLDDGSSQQNPSPTPYLDVATALPRAGDGVGAITGVIDFGLATSSNPGLGDYKIHPTVTPTFTSANPRTSAPAPVGGTVKVASFNVLNFFTTFTDGSSADGPTGQGCTLGTTVSARNCRGASNLAEFQRQRTKIVEAMAAIDADVLGLMEIQNNGNEAAQNLVDALNARLGSGTYVTTALPAQGTGTDAIRVAMIYKPSRLSAVGAPVSDTDPVNNRPPLAQTFLAKGERFTLVVNHLKSKGSCPAPNDPDAAGNIDSGDGQGCWNALRLNQAQRLRTFVATLQSTSGTSNALLIGDFNAYAQEDPIYNLTSSGYVDQVGRFSTFAYSYVFDGAAGRLDHAITTGALSAKVTGVALWHINADETPLADYNLEFKAPACATCPRDPYQPTPYRSSDHDPVVVGLNLLAVANDQDSCKQRGWTMRYRADGSGFKNQGDCVQYVNTGK